MVETGLPPLLPVCKTRRHAVGRNFRRRSNEHGLAFDELLERALDAFVRAALRERTPSAVHQILRPASLMFTAI
jgi:hypothetical protein